MELVPGLVVNLDWVVSAFVKVLLVMIFILTLIMVRQASLMDRVVNVPIGGWFKGLVWVFSLVVFLITLAVIFLL